PNIKKILLVVIILAVASFVFISISKKAPQPPLQVEQVKPAGAVYSVIGTSVQGRKIESYTYGTSTKKLVFVGGVHGGYEWNSILLAYQFKDYLDQNPASIPAGLSVVVIPNLNPDGQFKVIGKEGRFALADVSTSTLVQESGRFNANGVDLNRNFDCKWQSKSTWRSKEVSAGTAAFSEPEASAFRNFISSTKPSAVVFWHSQSNAVYASQCNNGILPGTLAIMDAYSKASLYPAVKTFDAYVTTGAADDWLASINIPAITVELKTHETVEFDRNLAGAKALFEYFRLK
ncbi:MAG: Peptidase protein, partial [Patescibacteria group bacterium]|nr:Peptidase protein [Patescibacteria group bacterium]